MAQQINLYDPALERTREWLTLGNLVLLALMLMLFVAALGVAARLELPTLAQRAADNESQLKALREQIALLGQTIAEKKPDPVLEQTLTTERQLLEARAAVRDLLKKHLGADAAEPFADSLRGLARQHLSGLWLTGFSLDAQGGMEIHGRTTDPARLPEYIQRLNKEAAFQGRAFAALKLEPGKPETPPGTGATAAAPPPAAAARAPWHEFTLTPVKADEPPARPAAAGRTG